MWDDGGGWWILMMLWMVLFWGAIAAGIVWLLTSLSRRQDQGDRGRGETAQQILDRRLASGEIDVDEYRNLRDELSRR